MKLSEHTDIEQAQTPRVWNMRDPNCPADAVRIDRRTFYGNPFRIGKDGTREEVIEKYRTYLYKTVSFVGLREDLGGEDLKCWCAPLPCHGDILLEIANA